MDFLAIFIEESIDQFEKWQEAILELEHAPTNKESWNALFRAAHTLKGSSRSVGLEAFGKYVHNVEDLISGLRDGLYQFDDHAKGVLSQSFEVASAWIDLIRERNDVNTPAPADMDGNISAIAKLLSAKSDPGQAASTATKPTAQAASTPSTRVDPNIRISAQKIDDLIRRVGELSTQSAMLDFELRSSGQASVSARSLNDQLAGSIRQLREVAMLLRVEPLGKFFSRMEKIAMDVARSQNKSLSISVVGRETDLDKTVADRIADPFVHLVRNAVDHGIEDAERRSKTGKNPTASLQISAKSEGNSISIAVQDDGKGLDPEHIWRKAVEKGILSGKETLSQEQKMNLILQAGFSTAEKVTDISGRGVGLDVVATTIKELGGSLSISSKLGFGSTFTLTLPASLAIIESFIVEVGGVLFAVPKREVEAIIDLPISSIRDFDAENPFSEWNGEMAPLIDLELFYGRGRPAGQNHLNCLVTKIDDGPILISFNRVAWEQDIVTSKVQGAFNRIPGIKGNTILANGEASLVISLHAIARESISLRKKSVEPKGVVHVS